MKTINAIPVLMDCSARRLVEVYVGRTKASAIEPARTDGGVFHRLKDHERWKGHEYGTVVLTGDTHDIVEWEDVVTALLICLRDENVLQVRNRRPGGGKIPWCSDSCMYITWKVTPDTGAGIVRLRERAKQRIAEEVAETHCVNEKPLFLALDALGDRDCRRSTSVVIPRPIRLGMRARWAA